MADSSVPNTESKIVAALSVSWEIVKITYNIPTMGGSREDKFKEITNAVIKSYKAILDQEPIEK